MTNTDNASGAGMDLSDSEIKACWPNTRFDFSEGVEDVIEHGRLIEQIVTNRLHPLVTLRTNERDDARDEAQELREERTDASRLLAEKEGELQRLRSALDHLLTSYTLMLAGKPVRDVSETLAEASAALKP